MKIVERIALIRVLSDLILADRVIDAGEMEYYAALKAEFRLSRDEEVEARQYTLAQALEVLSEADDELKADVIARCRRLSVSDGFCDRTEALHITAFERVFAAEGAVYSFPKHLFNIPDACLLYIESDPDDEVDNFISSHYRQIFSELRLAGFEFIYIPHIIDHYRHSDITLVDRIVSFVAPKLTQEGRKASIERLLDMDTAEFTKDILCNKLGMSQLRGTAPSLLLKIGASYVGDEIWSNYLKIDIDEADVVGVVRRLIDDFSAMLYSDVAIVSSDREHANQFLYSGFYKLLLDTHLLRRNVRSRIYVDPYKGKVYFPDIDVSPKLHRREKALYTLMLQRSLSGRGVNFTPPSNACEMTNFNKRMASLQKDYSRIYAAFGGDSDKAPDLTDSDLRRPMLSLINKQISMLKDVLHNADDYLISKDADGNYFVHIDSELVTNKLEK